MTRNVQPSTFLFFTKDEIREAMAKFYKAVMAEGPKKNIKFLPTVFDDANAVEVIEVMRLGEIVWIEEGCDVVKLNDDGVKYCTAEFGYHAA